MDPSPATSPSMPLLIDTEESSPRVQVPSSPSSARASPSSTTLAQELSSQPIPIWPSTSNPPSLLSTSQRSPSPPPLIPISVANELFSYAPHNSSLSSSSSPNPSSYQPWAAPPASRTSMEEYLATDPGPFPLQIRTRSQPSSSSPSSAVHLSQPPHPSLASYAQQPAFDGPGYQHPQAWSPFRRVTQEVGQHPSSFPSEPSTTTRMSASQGWMTGANQSSTREQQQAYYVRLQQQQHELLVAQAFASGRGRSQQHQVGGSSSSSAGSQQRIEVVDESSRLYFPPPHLHTTNNQTSVSLDSPTPTTALSQPTAANSSNAPIQRTASANLGHRVYLLACSHCALPLTDRGMKAVLLLKPHISLYSTDAVPVNVGPLFIPDGGGEAPKDGPERTCDCLTQGLGCCGCGSLLGYYIAVACARCTSSVAKNQRSANGHRFVFHQNEVVSTERLYTPNEPGVVSSAFPFTSLASSSSFQTSSNLSLSTTNHISLIEDTSAHKRSTSASSESDSSPTGSRPSSTDSIVSRGRALLAGDVVFWRDLVKGGERVAPWFGPRDAGKKRRRDDEKVVNVGARFVGR